jgi:predicted ATP-grasp superfamily ATP-dependent carboligase
LSRHFSFVKLSHDLLILGASTRAAAFSAIRCGLKPRCADYFADRDLAALCTVDRIDPCHAAQQFAELAESLAPSPWFYTGGFENDPNCLESVSRRHALWGIDAQTVRAVRNPVGVSDVLARNGIPCPEVRFDPAGLPRDASWLKKPLASGGGRGIEPLTDQNDTDTAAHYYQERIDGPSFSALFMGDRSRARLIGVTRQWIGLEGAPFGYLGSIGPVPTTEPLASRLESLGTALALTFGLAGWFGVDFVLRDEIPWPVEVNPRYTASLEIHELATGRSLLADHRQACEPRPREAQVCAQYRPTRVIAKWILHAARRLVAPEIVLDENDSDDLFGMRSIADIPWPGTCFSPGEPVISLLAAGANLAECSSRLIRLEQFWAERLGIVSGERIMGARLSDCSGRGGDDAIVL